MVSMIKDCSFFCSWSGGKDSCLSLYRAIKEGGRPRFLLTMLREEGERSRSHGLPVNLIRQQASSLGVPVVVRSSSRDDYEKVFFSALCEIKEEGVEVGVFGDIDLEVHREWVERVCSSGGVSPYFPLWQEDRRVLLEELLEAGFKATIVSVKEDVLDRDFLGKTLNMEVIKEMESVGIDASGEAGEYHTVVTDGPIFSTPLRLEEKGQIFRQGYWFLDVSVNTAD